MTHITVIEENAKVEDVFTLAACQGCDAGNISYYLLYFHNINYAWCSNNILQSIMLKEYSRQK